MKIGILSFICFAILSACTTIEDLEKIDSTRYFILEEDYLREQRRGIASQLWIEGLLAGKYSEFARGRNGTYFLGEGSPVVLLWDKAAKKYQETKIVKPGPFMEGSAEGGLWLPNTGNSSKPKLFFTLRSSGKTPSHGVASTAVAGAISDAIEGTLSFVPFSSEVEFINNLKIINE